MKEQLIKSKENDDIDIQRIADYHGFKK